jgi:hypothetical protein
MTITQQKTQLAGWVEDYCALNSDSDYTVSHGDGLSLIFVHGEHGDTIEYDPATQKLHVSAPVFTYGIPISPAELIEAGEAMVMLGWKLTDGDRK